MNDQWIKRKAEELHVAAQDSVDIDRDFAATLARAEGSSARPTTMRSNRWLAGVAAAGIVAVGVGALAYIVASPDNSTVPVDGTDVDDTLVPAVAPTTTLPVAEDTVVAPPPVATTIPVVSATTIPETTVLPETTVVPTTTVESVAPDPNTPVVPESTVPTSTTISFAWPAQSTATEQGGFIWAVVLAADPWPGFGEPVPTPAVDAARDNAATAGYNIEITPNDSFAGPAVGAEDSTSVVTASVYFMSEADARLASEGFALMGVTAVPVEIQTWGLD